MTRRPTSDDLVEGVLSGDRNALSRAITLVESTRGEDRKSAQLILDRLLPQTGNSARVGITGVPGVGKSTFIDALGTTLVESGHRVAVLAIDPSSEVTGGSILGDKTRMGRLSHDDRAYIRPSPAADATGGVAPRTREVMLLCEAAGFDVVFVETVGTGQSDLAVAHMVDTFVLLGLAGAGDELQGIKRGVMERADVIAVHKVDVADRTQVEQARADLMTAQRLVRHGAGAWPPPVLACSSVTGDGLADVWEAVQSHRQHLGAEGLAEKRRQQNSHWFDECLMELLKRRFFSYLEVEARLPGLRAQVLEGKTQPSAAAAELMQRFSGEEPGVTQ